MAVELGGDGGDGVPDEMVWTLPPFFFPFPEFMWVHIQEGFLSSMMKGHLPNDSDN